MKLNFPDFLLEKEIHVPELVVKGSSIKRILEEYSVNYLKENSNKMLNKKILKEDVTPDSEKRQQLMSLTVGVEEAVLKLYKFAVTDQNVDNSLVSVINKLKSHVSKFVNAIDARETKEEEVEEQKIDLNQPSEENRKDFIESEEVEDSEYSEEGKEVINENKNLNLKENKIWKVSVDISDEVKGLIECYGTNGFKSKKTKQSLKKLTESLKSNLDLLKENIGQQETALFEEFVDDIGASDSEGEFEANYSRMTEWANKGKKIYINID